jgi:putative ABC transport system permease protein
LASAIPAFSDAVQLRVLQTRVDANAENTRRPPFAFMYAYFGSISGQVEYEDYLKDDAFVRGRFAEILQLPITRTVRHLHTPKFRLFPAANSAEYQESNRQLEWVDVGFLSDFDERIQLFGERPKLRDDNVIEVLAYSELANEIGLQNGEGFILYGPPKRGAAPIQLTLKVTGIWAEKNVSDDYWFYRPDAFRNSLMVSEEQYAKLIAPNMIADAELSLWYFLVDGSRIDPEAAPFLLGRLQRFGTELTQQRNGLTNRISPAQALAAFIKATNELTLLLVIFSVPLLAVALYFIVLVAGMIVRRQEGEIAVLRSRGASSWSIAMLYIIEGLVVGGLGLGIGLAGGLALASIMTRLTTFLTLADHPPLYTQLGTLAIRFGIYAAIVGVLAALLPAVVASRRNIVSYRTSQSRSTRPPFWQRAFLDVLLLVPSIYLYYQMRNSGGMVALGGINATGATASADPFSDPVRFLAPVLMLAASALLLVRFFPLIMRGLAGLAAWLPVNTSILLALRSLARAPVNYVGPLLLLIFTMGLAVFSSSIAHTLDEHLTASTYYRIGADMRLIETGDSNKDSPGGDFGAPAPAPSSNPEEPLFYTFVPVQEHLRIPGVKAATRLGSYVASPKVPNAPERSEFVGIDRAEFPKAAYFRGDFANVPLGEMMNVLALNRSAIIVTQEFLAANRLRVGEPLNMNISSSGLTVPLSFTIAGTYNLFPEDAIREDDRATLFIGNLDYLFENAGTPLPYDVLLSVEPGAKLEKIVDGAGGQGFLVVNGYDSRSTIQDAQAKPERQGVFGLLSAGFIAASLLTVIGFVLSALISFRARAIQLGMLRTVGLSAVQMGLFIVLEQIILIVLGAVTGSGLGLLISRLYIPFMQVGGSLASSMPPFVVRIAWENLSLIYGALGAALFFALAVMLLLLRRLKAFEAIKLGAT